MGRNDPPGTISLHVTSHGATYGMLCRTARGTTSFILPCNGGYLRPTMSLWMVKDMLLLDTLGEQSRCEPMTVP